MSILAANTPNMNFQDFFRFTQKVFFLVATSSSVRVSVCVSLFFLLVSLESVVDLQCHKQSKSVKGIQWESMCVSRVLQGSFKGVSKKFLG